MCGGYNALLGAVFRSVTDNTEKRLKSLYKTMCVLMVMIIFYTIHNNRVINCDICDDRTELNTVKSYYHHS